uniref:Thiamine transporter 2 n=1 Tax=Panagrellus redivivus TaxID=6233 RepID=A0A7E4VIU5_PANRE
MAWWYSAVLLCAFGVLKEFRLTEPYFYNYQHDDLHLSDSVLNDEVYPIWTYGYLIALVPALLLSDVLLYKPVILLGATAYVSVWVTLIFGKDKLSQQLGQAIYSIATASEVAYFAYIYVKVDRSKYSRVTAWTRAALLAGKCTSYVLAEVLILTKAASYQTLNYITISALGLAFTLALFLPQVSWKAVVTRNIEGQVTIRNATPLSPNQVPENYWGFCKDTMLSLKENLVIHYSNKSILKWSLWWAMATCGELQVGNYAQTLWGQLQDSDGDNNLNGFIEASCPFIAMIAILAVERSPINWSHWGEIGLVIAALIDGALLIIMSQAQQLWLMYVVYVCFRVFYQIMITIAQANIVTEIASHAYGFVFGINTLVALLLQSLLTAIAVQWIKLDIRPQFVTYGLYHVAISIIFASVAVKRLVIPKLVKLWRSS